MAEEQENKKAEPPIASPPSGEAKEPAAKHAAAKSPSGPVGEPWSGEPVVSLRNAFQGVAIEAYTYLGQNYLIVPRESILPLVVFLKTEWSFNLLTDLTAVDYPQREKRFEVIYQLYSFSRNERLRLKVPLGEPETLESVVTVWAGADWMEREAYDMFGIVFDHHPNLKRILLPEEWQGHPLRKDYGILQQDVQWVKENLHIESGQ
ncbi:MAG: NADH-quinone oxidoreductase subunit C [Acidobacteria bacterium]|nr:NADH-quinone oxidoreductase subunit C [Acidobacteriota bacterium]